MARASFVAVSERFRLRRLRDDDVPLVCDWHAQTRLPGEYLGADDAIGVGELREALRWEAEGAEEVRFWMLETQVGEPAGTASWRPDLPWRWVLELEFMLAPQFRSRGLGLEASRLVIDHLFSSTDAAKLMLRISALNRPAFPVIRRLGGREEGRLRRHLRIDGREVDLVIYGLLREEWDVSAHAA